MPVLGSVFWVLAMASCTDPPTLECARVCCHRNASGTQVLLSCPKYRGIMRATLMRTRYHGSAHIGMCTCVLPSKCFRHTGSLVVSKVQRYNACHSYAHTIPIPPRWLECYTTHTSADPCNVGTYVPQKFRSVTLMHPIHGNL
jgi:hypothetical protein